MSNPFSKAPQVNYQPVGITNSTGTSIGPGGGVTQSPDLQKNLAGLSSTFASQDVALGGLYNTIAPGFSNLRQAGTNAINNAYTAQQSTLQQNLAQRRIAGSSFADAANSQLTSQQAQDLANFNSQAYLAELQSSFNVLQAQYAAGTAQYSVAINQSNIDSALAASLTSSNNQIAAQIATANAKLQAQSSAGAGSFVGSLLGLGTGANNSTVGGGILNAASGGLSGLFGGGGGAFSSGAPAIANLSGSSLFGGGAAASDLIGLAAL